MPSFEAPTVNTVGTAVYSDNMTIGQKIWETYTRIIIPVAVAGGVVTFVGAATGRLIFGRRGATVGLPLIGGRSALVEGTLAGTIEEAPEQPPAPEVILPPAPPPASRPPNDQVVDAPKDPVDVAVDMPPMWMRDP